MGTASTMNALAEALGMSLPGCAAIPAPYRERGQIAYETGVRAVELVHEDIRPTDILTRKAFENAIVANSAIGGSTNAPIHINAIARHVGVKLTIQDWEKIGYDVPLLVNMQPAGKYLGEEYYRAGGLPAVMRQLLKAGKGHADALTINGKTMGDNVRKAAVQDADVFRVFTWQGGALTISPLHPSADGTWTIDAPVPVGGSWKNIVFLEKGDVVAAIPVAFPADPTYALAAIDPPTGSPRVTTFSPSTAYLTRETHGGAALPAILAYTTLGVIGIAWCVAVIGVGEAMRRRVTASISLPAALKGAG